MQSSDLSDLFQRVRSFIEQISRGEPVPELQVKSAVEMLYELLRLGLSHPPCSEEIVALSYLSSMPEHVALTEVRARARGAVDMASRWCSWAAAVSVLRASSQIEVGPVTMAPATNVSNESVKQPASEELVGVVPEPASEDTLRPPDMNASALVDFEYA